MHRYFPILIHSYFAENTAYLFTGNKCKNKSHIDVINMRKTILLIIVAFIIQSNLSSQSCLPDGITFSTQADIDNFQTNYPNCIEIEGDVHISGTDITNLLGLSVITSFTGDLIIGENSFNSSNPSLTSLTGLNNLTHIGGKLSVQNNEALTSLTGFDNLTSIGGGCYVWNNFNMLSLTGFNNMTLFSGDLSIGDNPLMNTLTGLENVTSIGDYFEIGTMDGLTDLSEMENLTFIGGGLWIGDNYNLTNLNGLENLTSTGRVVTLVLNPALTDISALSNLTSIGTNLGIKSNASLTNLYGLDNIAEESIIDLEIINNAMLSSCAVQSVCDYLVSPNGYVQIHDNATGCNSQEEIEDACHTIGFSELSAELNFLIYPNPAQGELLISNRSGIKIDEVNIYNQFGQKVLQQKGTTNKIEISTLSPSIYIIELVSGEYRLKEKFVF